MNIEKTRKEQIRQKTDLRLLIGIIKPSSSVCMHACVLITKLTHSLISVYNPFRVGEKVDPYF